MKKNVIWIVLSLILVTSAYLLSGIICDIFRTFANNERIIPIYCVDCKEKKIALTFDAAWDAC